MIQIGVDKPSAEPKPIPPISDESMYSVCVFDQMLTIPW